MSRRTKLIITALFLVLIGISVSHLTLTWRPHEPLRIRLVREHEELEMRERLQYRVLEIEVENTSSVPIHLGSITIHREDRPSVRSPREPIGRVEVTSSGAYPTTDVDGNPIIPARGLWRGKAFSRHVLSGDLRDGYTFFIVTWMSRTRYRCMDLYWSLVQRLPESWRNHLPTPAYDEDILLLDTSSH